MEAFTALLWEGVHRLLDYVARATTPGTLPCVLPPKAEEMYHPETFGRGGDGPGHRGVAGPFAAAGVAGATVGLARALGGALP